MKLSSLFEVIQKARQSHPKFAQRLEEAEALSRWETAVGPLIAKHAKAMRVQESILWIEVENPIWKSELHFRKRQILDILNGTSPCVRAPLGTPKEILKDIYFVQRTSPERRTKKSLAQKMNYRKNNQKSHS